MFFYEKQHIRIATTHKLDVHTQKQAPFHGENDEELAKSIAAGVPAAPHAETLPEDARDLITRLLEPQPERRLVDCDAIKAHPFFERINFEALYKKQVPPPPLPPAVAAAAAAALAAETTPSTDAQPQLPPPQTESSGSSSTPADPFAGFTFVTSRVS